LTEIGEHTTVRSLVGRLDLRDVEAGSAALLVIDLQRLCAGPDGEHARKARELDTWDDVAGYFDRVNDVVVPNVRRLADAARRAGSTVIYARCRSLTSGARDNGRRFHDFGIAVEPDSPEAALVSGIELEPGDVLLDKTTASVFLSTNLDVLLRQLGVRSLITTGVVTSGCVESTVRDACDLDYEVLLVEDACADRTDALHEDAIRRLNNNFAAAASTDGVLAALGARPALQRSAGGR
jgi:ureidoacrylate peracid hydrolase